MAQDITDIEKAARLMGYELSEWHPPAMKHLGATINGGGKAKMFFNPYTNKADLMDLECELGVDVSWDGHKEAVSAEIWKHGLLEFMSLEEVSDHPTKFAARAEAVIAVCVQIYDAKYGKDGE